MPRSETSFDALSVGQVAERSGVAISALHFYEANHLITSSRNPGNQRRFTRDTLRRVAFIRASQRVGVPLVEMAEALARLPEQRTPTPADREAHEGSARSTGPRAPTVGAIRATHPSDSIAAPRRESCGIGRVLRRKSRAVSRLAGRVVEFPAERSTRCSTTSTRAR